MTLRFKLFLAISAIFIIFAGIKYEILTRVVFPEIVAWEQKDARKRAGLIAKSIQREVDRIDALTHSLVSLDDIYNFIRDRNRNYIKECPILRSFLNDDLNLIYLLDDQGKVVWGEIRDLKTKKILKFPEFSSTAVQTIHQLLSRQTNNDPPVDKFVKGIFVSGRWPLLVSARPILTNKNIGPVRGTLIIGRYLNEDVIKSMIDQSQYKFQVWLPADASISSEDRIFFDKITSTRPVQIDDGRQNLLRIYTTYPDIAGNPGLFIKATFVKTITAKGVESVRYAAILSAIGWLAALVALAILLQIIVLKPISQLTHHVVKMGNCPDSTYKKLPVQSNDEVGKLVNEFNRMVEKITDTRNKLLEVSYYSGQAEMASGILHNVRNILIPILGKISILHKKINDTSTDKIERALRELKEDGVGDDRKRSLIHYLQLKSSRMASLIREMGPQLETISHHFDQVEFILARQQNYYYSGAVLEPLNLKEIALEAYDLLPQKLKDSTPMEIDPQMALIPKVVGERTVLVQVFLNLLQNAGESIVKSNVSKGQIHITGTVQGLEDTKVIHTKIKDNGHGINRNDLQRIFDRGFTKKDSKHAGLGLHWCWSVVSALSGRLYAESNGIGQGACFHLEIPLRIN